jgi:hypothetical protein
MSRMLRSEPALAADNKWFYSLVTITCAEARAPAASTWATTADTVPNQTASTSSEDKKTRRITLLHLSSCCATSGQVAIHQVVLPRAPLPGPR